MLQLKIANKKGLNYIHKQSTVLVDVKQTQSSDCESAWLRCPVRGEQHGEPSTLYKTIEKVTRGLHQLKIRLEKEPERYTQAEHDHDNC